MPSTFNISAEAANAEADAFAAKLNGGGLKVYSGTQPATVATALSGNTLLVTLPFAAAAANGAASGGIVDFNIAAMSGVAGNAGTPSFGRAYKSDGTTAVFDCSVGLAAATPDLIIDISPIAAGDQVNAVAPFRYQRPLA